MKKMGKWLLSLLVAVSLTMPVLADVNVQSTGTEFESEIGAAELQADTEQAIESQTEAEPESQTEPEEQTEEQTEPEEQTEEQTEDPVDVELDDYLNTSVVLQNASSIGFDRVQIQWQPFSLLEVEGYRIYRKAANSKWAVLADVTDTSYIDTTVEMDRSTLIRFVQYRLLRGSDILVNMIGTALGVQQHQRHRL